MKIQTNVKIDARCEVLVTDKELRELPQVKAAIKRAEERGLRISSIDVHYTVPGGGDWSGENAPVDKDHPVSIVVLSVGGTDFEEAMQPLPKRDECEVMTVPGFVDAVKAGSFVDDDGIGYYATATEMSKEIARPSEVRKNKINPYFTHVVWFNK